MSFHPPLEDLLLSIPPLVIQEIKEIKQEIIEIKSDQNNETAATTYVEELVSYDDQDKMLLV